MQDPNVSAHLSGVFMIHRKTSMDEELISGIGVVMCIRRMLKEFWLVIAFKEHMTQQSFVSVKRLLLKNSKLKI